MAGGSSAGPAVAMGRPARAHHSCRRTRGTADTPSGAHHGCGEALQGPPWPQVGSMGHPYITLTVMASPPPPKHPGNNLRMLGIVALWRISSAILSTHNELQLPRFSGGNHDYLKWYKGDLNRCVHWSVRKVSDLFTHSGCCLGIRGASPILVTLMFCIRWICVRESLYFFSPLL